MGLGALRTSGVLIKPEAAPPLAPGPNMPDHWHRRRLQKEASNVNFFGSCTDLQKAPTSPPPRPRDAVPDWTTLPCSCRLPLALAESA